MDGAKVFTDFKKEIKRFFLSIIGWIITFISFTFLKWSGYEYVDGVKNYSDYSPNPFIKLPLIARAYGWFLIVKKVLRLEKQFENA